jgi:hypothetical protein
VGAGGARGERTGEPGDIARRGVRTPRRADGMGWARGKGGRLWPLCIGSKPPEEICRKKRGLIGGETVCLGESDPGFYRHLVRNSEDDGTTGGDASNRAEVGVFASCSDTSQADEEPCNQAGREAKTAIGHCMIHTRPFCKY